MKQRIVSALFLMATAGLSFGQGGSMTVLPGLNTVQNRMNPTATPDPTIAVGTIEFCEHVNSGYQCWYKSGPNAYQPVDFLGSSSPKLDDNIWSQNSDNFGNTPHCPLANSPNAQILHDNVYNTWIMQKRISDTSNGHNYMCLAIGNVEDLGQTSPVSFSWFAYEFDLDTVIPTNAEGNFYYPDYPQAGLWQTSTSANPPYAPAKDQAMWITYDLQDVNAGNNTAGILVCAVDLAGLRASTSNPYVNNSKTPACVVAHGISPFTQRDNWVPANNSDTTPPLAGDGEMFTYMIEPPNNGTSYLTDPLHTQGVEQWTIDWTVNTPPGPTPSEVNSWDLPSTQANGDQLACFHAGNYYDTVCIPQPSTTIQIDSVGDRMQQFFHYTSNGGLGGIWTSSHAIQLNPNKTQLTQTEADVRVLQWNQANPPSIVIATDEAFTDPNDPNAYVFLPSMARDKVGNLQGIVGVSNNSTDPNENPGLDSIFYIPANSTLGSYGYIANPATSFDAEDSDPANYRWGDWYGAVLDPSDSCTVWVVGEYLAAPRTVEPFWYTQIAELPPTNNCLNSGVAFSSANVVFNSQQVGITSAPQSVTLFNNQGIALSISSITASGDFAQTNTCGSSVPADGNCVITITFTPTATGTRTGTLAVNDSAGTGQQTVNLTGTGVTTPVTLSSSVIAFGNQAAGTSSAPAKITLTNSGGTPLTVSTVSVSGGFTDSDNCAGTVVAPSQTCTMNVTFKPSLPGAFAGALTVSDSSVTSPQLVGLSGTGVLPLTFSPSTMNFGNVTVDTNNGTKTLTVTNNSSTTLTLTVSASGNYAATGSGKSPCASSLAPAASCTYGVTFTPTENGAIKGSVALTYNGAFSPQVVPLTGTGVGGAAGQLTFSVSTLTFQNVVLGSTSVTKIVTATNAGTTSLTISSVAASGDFLALAGGKQPCSGSIAAGGKCTFQVNFTPTTVGTTSGSVTITDNASNSPQILNLSGNALFPVTVSPASLSFAAQTVGTTSASQTITLTNNQSKVLSLNSILASGDFVITTASTNPCGSSLAASSQCNIGVAFAPTMTGAITGAVTINDNASYAPQEVSLSGTGQ